MAGQVSIYMGIWGISWGEITCQFWSSIRPISVRRECLELSCNCICPSIFALNGVIESHVHFIYMKYILYFDLMGMLLPINLPMRCVDERLVYEWMKLFPTAMASS